jgi:hypothetical protein
LVQQWDVVVQVCLSDSRVFLSPRNFGSIVSKSRLTFSLSSRVLSIMIRLLLPNRSIKCPDQIDNLLHSALEFHLELDGFGQSFAEGSSLQSLHRCEG